VAVDDACPQRDSSEHLAEDQAPVTDAFVCTYVERAVPGDGIWSFRVAMRITGGLDHLLDVYATPNAPRGSRMCTLDLPNPLVVFLHTADSTAAVRSPVNACGKPIGEAKAAFEALELKEVGSHKEQQVQSEQSQATGCTDQYKDVVQMYAENGRPDNASATPIPLTGTLKVCRFRVVPDKDGDRIGQLESGGTVDLTAFDQALADSSLDDTCSTTEHTRFALVTGARGGDVVVALDGCALYEERAGYFRGTDALRALLQP
jgi:hypothetical protein